MRKKLLSLALAVMIAASAFAVFAAAADGNEKLFTDFDSLASFEEGVDIVDKADITSDTFKDYYGGAYDWDTVLQSKVSLEIADGVGADGSKALKLVKNDTTENAWVELYANPANNIATDYSGAKYLVLWVDFTDVEFRKACFGVIAKDHTLYRTDELDDRSDIPFYLLKDGTWTEMFHGGDGCFGSAQDSAVNGFKGYAAFPLDSFVSWDSNDAPFDASTTQIDGVFFYFDVESSDYLGKAFYFDNICFVNDYTAFDAAALKAEEPSEEPSSEEPSSEEPASEEPAESSEEPAVSTSDSGMIALAVIAALAAAGAVVVSKRK